MNFLSVFQPSKHENPALNGLRGFLLILVILCHIYMVLHDAGKTAPVGMYAAQFFRGLSLTIDAFFVLSGFLISGPLFIELEKKGTISLKTFFIKRSFRIFPPYYIFLLLQLAITLVLMEMTTDPIHLETARVLLSRFVYDFLYISNYFPGTLLQGWSLSLEEQFYVSFPFFLLFIYRKLPYSLRFPSLVILLIIPIVYRFFAFFFWISPQDPHLETTYRKYIYNPFQGHFDAIIMGILLSFFLKERKELIQAWTKNRYLNELIHFLFWVSLIVYNTIFSELEYGVPSMVLRFSVNSFCFAGIIFYCLKGGWIATIFSTRLLLPFAKLSYVAYIVHMFLLGFILAPLQRVETVTSWDILKQWIPAILGIYVFSYLFHLVAELPFVKLKELTLKRFGYKE